jgi:signal transduction histidine kinase
MERSRVAISDTEEPLDGQLSWRVQLRWFASIGILEIRLRWIAALLVVATTWFASSILRIPLQTRPLYLLGLCILAYNAVLWGYLGRGFAYPRRASGYDYESLLRHYWRGLEEEGAIVTSQFQTFVKVQLGLDWLVMVLLVHFSGGVTSPLLFFFVFHLILASILLSRRACYLFATLAALAIGALSLLEYSGVVPAVSLGYVSEALQRNGLYVASVWMFFTTSLYLSIYLATTLTRRLRQRDEELLRLQTQLANAYLQLQTVYEVTRTATSTLDLKQVLNLIAKSASEAMQAKACAIVVAGESGLLADGVACHGLEQEYLDKGSIDAESTPYVTQTLASGRPTIVANTANDRQLWLPAEAEEAGIASILCVPLMIRDEPEGVICVYGDEPDQFIQSDAGFLSALASAGATAVENARAYEAVQIADRAKSDFMRMVTHEFRSPLSSVQSMLRLLEMGLVGSLTDKQQDLVKRSQRRILLMLEMVSDLLELAAGKMEMLQATPQQVNLTDLILRVAEPMESIVQEKSLDCRLDMGQEPILLNAVEVGLERVVTNLLSNAVKYTPEGGSVMVKARSEADLVRLEVSDTGIGIPEEALPRIFTEFYRAGNAKAAGIEGTGLGLVLVKEVVEQHGGEITVESRPGEGTTFRVSLPKR